MERRSRRFCAARNECVGRLADDRGNPQHPAREREIIGRAAVDGKLCERTSSCTVRGKIVTPLSHPRAQQMDASGQLFRIVQENHSGKHVGISSICSANRFVLEAGMEQAKRDASLLCIESTSNQVNQFGGYTGKTPAEFAAFVKEVAKAEGFPQEMILLGGDHIGPHVWRAEKAASAMARARELVQGYVRAGYTKIHLDASMPCADDPGDRKRPLADELVSERAAELCLAAEEAHKEIKAGSPAPLYVIGTEVPIPGGEQEGSRAPEVTSTEDLARTLATARQAFYSRFGRSVGTG